MSLSRQVTVRMPRPESPTGSAQWPPPSTGAPEPQARLTWSPLAARPLPSRASVQAAPASGHGRHRARGSLALRVATFVIGLACLGAAFGAGWALGEQWAPDRGASMAVQWQSMVDEVRDWALGM